MKHIFLLLAMSFSMSAFSQSNSIDARLLSHFSSNQLKEMEEDSPGTLEFWDSYVSEGYFVTPFNSLKHEGKLTQMEIPEEIDLLALEIFPLPTRAQRFLDPQKNVVLHVYSEKTVRAKLNNKKEKK
jgi:hypothetical protein